MIRRTLSRTVALLGLSLGLASAALAADPPPATFGWQQDVTGATAAAYCMAKHPYQYLATQISGSYTKEGYELVGPPGVVGAVRRNFVQDRTSDTYDEGVKQTCAQACGQFGKVWGLVGKSLRQKVGDGRTIIASGLGDLAALVTTDHSYYLGGPTTAMVSSRANTWHESDVAEADYCCCHAVQ